MIAICTFLILANHKHKSSWIRRHRIILWSLPWGFSLAWATLGVGLDGYSNIGGCTSEQVTASSGVPNSLQGAGLDPTQLASWSTSCLDGSSSLPCSASTFVSTTSSIKPTNSSSLFRTILLHADHRALLPHPRFRHQLGVSVTPQSLRIS